ncbi:hypothetical protein Dimus_023379 [Dionaea muscipula]
MLQLRLDTKLFDPHHGASWVGMGYYLPDSGWALHCLCKLAPSWFSLHRWSEIHKIQRYHGIPIWKAYVQYYMVFPIFHLSTWNHGFLVRSGETLMEINLAFSDTALRLQYNICITGVAYFIFAFAVPNMSFLRVWLGVSAILTSRYIGFMLAAVANDGKSIDHWDFDIEGCTEQI